MGSSRAATGLLLAPAALVFLALLVLPLVFVLRLSFLPSVPGASLDGPFGLRAYAELADPYVLTIFWRTLRIAGITTIGCLVLGYPLAISLTRARGRWRTIQALVIVSPLFVSVIVRAYGWTLLLGNRGMVNTLAGALGFRDEPLRLLGTEFGVIVALAEALLPFMVLSLAAVLDGLDPGLEEAARGLGDSALGAFWRVTLPLSLPGALAGSLLVFMVAMGSYATPALVGGSRVRVMVTEIYTQVTSVFNWPLGAALSIVLLGVSLSVLLIVTRLAVPGRLSGAS